MARLFLILILIIITFFFLMLIIKMVRWFMKTNFFDLFFNINKKIKNSYYQAKIKSLELEKENQELSKKIKEKEEEKNQQI